MNRKTLICAAVTVLALPADFGLSCATQCPNSPNSPPPRTDERLDAILTNLKNKTAQIKSYQAEIEYLFTQPQLESQTLRKGLLYYKKSDEKSKLRLNFKTLKQDDEDQRQYREDYIFDGTWLIHLDYEIRSHKRRQLADPNEPIDAFDLARRNFPIVGFGRTEDLKKEFEISLAEPNNVEKDRFLRLHLKVKPDSQYKDQYRQLDFWIDAGLYLPARIVTTTTEDDIYKIELLNAKINEPLDEAVFDVKVPDDFPEPQVIPPGGD